MSRMTISSASLSLSIWAIRCTRSLVSVRSPSPVSENALISGYHGASAVQPLALDDRRARDRAPDGGSARPRRTRRRISDDEMPDLGHPHHVGVGRRAACPAAARPRSAPSARTRSGACQRSSAASWSAPSSSTRSPACRRRPAPRSVSAVYDGPSRSTSMRHSSSYRIARHERLARGAGAPPAARAAGRGAAARRWARSARGRARAATRPRSPGAGGRGAAGCRASRGRRWSLPLRPAVVDDRQRDDRRRGSRRRRARRRGAARP